MVTECEFSHVVQVHRARKLSANEGSSLNECLIAPGPHTMLRGNTPLIAAHNRGWPCFRHL